MTSRTKPEPLLEWSVVFGRVTFLQDLAISIPMDLHEHYEARSNMRRELAKLENSHSMLDFRIPINSLTTERLKDIAATIKGTQYSCPPIYYNFCGKAFIPRQRIS